MTEELPKRLTYKDIAKAAGVSTTAVSFVLNRTGSISEEVRARVLATAKAMSYRPNQRAQALRTGRSMTFGLVLPDLRNPFFPELANAIGERARKSGYSIVLAESGDEEREREALDRLTSHGVDGICWCPTSKKDLPTELDTRVPIVVIDRPMPRYDAVASNDVMGGKLIADLVCQSGFASVGMVLGPQDMPGIDQRRHAIVDALGARCPVLWEIENDLTVDLRPAVVARLRHASVDVVICANDMIAIGVIRTLQQLGFDVPADISVLGFDDIPWARLVQPALTTIRQPLREIGRVAIQLLLRRIASPKSAISTRHIDVSLIMRGSTPSRQDQDWRSSGSTMPDRRDNLP